MLCKCADMFIATLLIVKALSYTTKMIRIQIDTIHDLTFSTIIIVKITHYKNRLAEITGWMSELLTIAKETVEAMVGV